MSALTVTVSGKTYHGALDPHATDVPREEGWPAPTARRRGRGEQFVYELTREQADSMAEHLETLGENFTRYTDSEDVEVRAEGRACLKDAKRIRAQLDQREAKANPEGAKYRGLIAEPGDRPGTWRYLWQCQHLHDDTTDAVACAQRHLDAIR